MTELLHGYVDRAGRASRPSATAPSSSATSGSRTARSRRRATGWRGCCASSACSRGDRVALLVPKSPDGDRRRCSRAEGRRASTCRWTARARRRASRASSRAAEPARCSSHARRRSSCSMRWPDDGVLGSSPIVSLDDALAERAVRSSAFAASRRRSTRRRSASSRRRPRRHILFTSGSTGVPKGVMITHANVIGLRRVGRRATSASAPATAVRALAAPLRPVDVRHLRHLRRRRRAAPRAGELNLLPHELAALHPRPRADAVVLGARRC